MGPYCKFCNTRCFIPTVPGDGIATDLKATCEEGKKHDLEKSQKVLSLNAEEAVIVHNAVIFMANDLMEEIVELEAWIAEKEEERAVALPELKEKKRRWDVMVSLAERVRGDAEIIK